MTADRDQHGLTAADIRRALAQPTDEPHERHDPESYCTPCGWTGHHGGTCHCDDGIPRS